MQQDRLQIALEHHRAGRLRQAGAGYRALLVDDPGDPDALHWLGVLLTQAGDAAAGIPLLQRAVDAVPDDAAWQHNLGQALLAAGRLDDAITALTESAALEPGRAETFLALARVYAIRRAGSDPSAAVAALRRAHEQGIDTPQLHHDLGVALLAAGQPDDAIASLDNALRSQPGYAPALFQKAMAFRAKTDRKATRNYLNQALEADRQYAQAWHALGVLDAEVGNFDLAIGHLRRSIRYRPGWVAPYRSLETLLRRIGRTGEAEDTERELRAAQAATEAQRSFAAQHPSTDVGAEPAAAVAELEDRLTFDTSHARLHEALSAMSGLISPARATPAAIAKLFDGYAERFDKHLRQTLGYAGPEQVMNALSGELAGRDGLNVLDVGCGTGLCGPLLRPFARALVGVDLSARMLEKAADRQVYDQLEQVDLLEKLRQSPSAYDLLVAADVLIYMGDLTPVFELAWQALRPGGLFALTLESGTGDRYQRDHRTRRFRHAAAYVQRLASIFAFEQRHFETVILRREIREPVPAFVLVLRKPSS